MKVFKCNVCKKEIKKDESEVGFDKKMLPSGEFITASFKVSPSGQSATDAFHLCKECSMQTIQRFIADERAGS